MSAEEINEARKANAAKIQALRKKANAIYKEWDATPHAVKLATPYEERLIRKANKIEKEITEANKISAILRNNYRIKRLEEITPILAEILQKYAGKPYGEKTAEKMKKELFERARAYFYIDREYSYIMRIYEAREDGFTDAAGEHFTIWQHPAPYFLDNLNKINAPTVEKWRPEGIKPYAERPAELIKELDKLKAKAEKMAEALKRICKEYNTNAPEGLQELDPRAI